MGKPLKTRKSYFLAGLSPAIEYAVYNNSHAALKRAILERVFYVKTKEGFAPPPLPESGLFETRLSCVNSILKKSSVYSTAMTATAFAESYHGPKNKIYSRAAQSLEVKIFTKGDAKISSFMKCEKYNFTAKPDPVPRIIQPRCPRALVTYGRYIKPIEKKIYHSINHMFGSTTIFKGLNADQRGQSLRKKWNRFRDPVCVGLDASRFDQHVSVEALKWEHNIYGHYYPGDKHFKWLMSLQLYNSCYARLNDSLIRYKTKGCRMSGDMNTALGNCLLMSSMVYAYAKHKTIDIELANDGDDCVVFMEKCDLHQFQSELKTWFLEMGFTMEVEEPVYTLEKVVFCQSQPVYDGTNYVMVRDPRVAIAKDCLAIKPLDNVKVFERWCAAVGLGGMSLTGGIPVWQNFYRTIVVSSKGQKPLSDPSLMTGMRLLAKGMSRLYKPPTDECRFSFYLAFGIHPEEQLACEKYYDSVDLSWGSDETKIKYVNLPLNP